jgi:hypothetical protein
MFSPVRFDFSKPVRHQLATLQASVAFRMRKPAGLQRSQHAALFLWYQQALDLGTAILG